MITTRRVLVTVTAFAVAAALVLIARAAVDATPTSDTAVIESYTLLASRGDLLLGPYSRFQWHHPGPLYFFWMVPFYAFAGFQTVGLNAGALALNLAALAVIAAIISRRADGVTAIAVFGTTAVFAWRAAEVLSSPWNPHIPVLPMMALIVAATDTVSGTPGTLPVVCALASLVGQTHVGLLPSAIAIGGTALAGAVVPILSDGHVHKIGRTLFVSGIVLLALWTPPIVDQFTGRPGNITRLWNFFVVESHPGQTFSTAGSAWSDMLTGLARPDFSVAYGWRFHESPVKWAESFAVVQLVALLIGATWAFRATRRFELALAALLTLTSLLALWSATRIEGAIFDHEVFWISGVGAINMAFLLALVTRPLMNRVFDARAIRRTAAAFCWILIAVSAIAGGLYLREAVNHSANPGLESETARAVADDLRGYLNDQKITRPLIRLDQDAWGMAAGVILRLQKTGVPVAVEDDWLAMFTPRFAASGQELVVLMVAGKAQHVRMVDAPGDTVIVSRDPLFVHLEPSRAIR